MSLVEHALEAISLACDRHRKQTKDNHTMNDITQDYANPVSTTQANPEDLMGMFQKMMQAWLELPKLNARLTELEAEVSRVTSDNSWLRSERERLIEEVNHLTLERVHTTEHLALLEKDNANLIGERDHAKAVSQALGSEVGSLNAQLSNYVNEAKKSADDLAQAQLDNEELKKRLETALSDGAQWQFEHDRQVEARRLDNEANANTIRELRNDLQVTSNNYTQSQARIVRLFEVIHEVESVVGRTSNI